MELHKLFGPITKGLFIVAIGLILYSNVCRWINLYFFWESGTVGWILILIGIIGLLWNSMEIKKAERRNTTYNKVGIGIIVFGLILATITLIANYYSDIYKDAKTQIENDKKVKNSIGKVRDVVLLPKSNIVTSTTNKGTMGNAQIFVIIKGANKYSDSEIILEKTLDDEYWRIVAME